MTRPRYEVRVKRSAAKAIAKLPGKHRRQVQAKVVSPGFEPRPQDSTKLEGHEDTYRVTQGEYRIIYEIEDEVRVALVTRVGKHNDDEVYRGLQEWPIRRP